MSSLAAFDRALTLKPEWAEPWLGRGNACFDLNRHEDAISAYNKALALNPQYAAAHANRATVFLDLKRFDEALAGFEKSLQLDPGLAKAWLGRGSVFVNYSRYQDAVRAFKKALELDSHLVEAWHNLAVALAHLKQFDEAIAACNQALALKPDLVNAAGTRLNLKLLTSDWNNLRAEGARLVDVAGLLPTSNDDLADEAVSGSRIDIFMAVEPMNLARLIDDGAILQACAIKWVRACASYPVPFTHVRRTRSGKFRLGYMSQDFRQHVTGRGFVELFEKHDTSRFELHGISLFSNDGSAIRQRIEAAFDRFHDVVELGDEAAARTHS